MAISVAREYQTVSHISQNHKDTHGSVHNQEEAARFEVSLDSLIRDCQLRLLSLVSFSYKCREDFCVDVRQIFDNCEMFNEDDSPVGKAGHGMRKFFESRWGELTDKHS